MVLGFPIGDATDSQWPPGGGLQERSQVPSLVSPVGVEPNLA